jgi:hypothetical protein
VKVDIVAHDARHVSSGTEDRLGGLLRDAADCGGDETAGAGAPALQLFWDVGDTMVRGQRDDVLVAADEGIEPVEQLTDGPIELRVHVAHFLARRAELMADEIRRGKADREDIGRAPPAQSQTLGQAGRHPADVRVGERTVLPEIVELRIGYTSLADQRMRERSRPAFGRRLALAGIGLRIPGWRQDP